MHNPSNELRLILRAMGALAAEYAKLTFVVSDKAEVDRSFNP